MAYFMTGERLLLSVITGKEHARIFESEIQKKKLLDAIAEMTDYRAKNDKGYLRIYGYCILDDAGYFLVGSDQEELLVLAQSEIMSIYERKRLETGFGTDAKTDWESDYTEVEEEEFWEKLIRLHYLPVSRGYTIEPQDYWWSSYLEYELREWVSCQTGYIIRCIDENPACSKREVRRRHRLWKKNHPEIYLKNYRNMLPL